MFDEPKTSVLESLANELERDDIKIEAFPEGICIMLGSGFELVPEPIEVLPVPTGGETI